MVVQFLLAKAPVGHAHTVVGDTSRQGVRQSELSGSVNSDGLLGERDLLTWAALFERLVRGNGVEDVGDKCPVDSCTLLDG